MIVHDNSNTYKRQLLLNDLNVCIHTIIFMLDVFKHAYHFFAVLLEVTLRKRLVFNQRYLLLDFSEGTDIIYHLIAYDPKIDKNCSKLLFWLPWPHIFQIQG